MVKNQPTCAYCGKNIFRGQGTYIDVGKHIAGKRYQKRLVHKNCEEKAHKLLENKGRGYYSLIMGKGGNPKRLFEGDTITADLI